MEKEEEKKKEGNAFKKGMKLEKYPCVIINETTGEEKENICEKIIYPHTKIEEAVSLNAEIDVLRQPVYELNERIKILEK